MLETHMGYEINFLKFKTGVTIDGISTFKYLTQFLPDVEGLFCWTDADSIREVEEALKRLDVEVDGCGSS